MSVERWQERHTATRELSSHAELNFQPHDDFVKLKHVDLSWSSPHGQPRLVKQLARGSTTFYAAGQLGTLHERICTVHPACMGGPTRAASSGRTVVPCINGRNDRCCEKCSDKQTSGRSTSRTPSFQIFQKEILQPLSSYHCKFFFFPLYQTRHVVLPPFLPNISKKSGRPFFFLGEIRDILSLQGLFSKATKTLSPSSLFCANFQASSRAPLRRQAPTPPCHCH